MDGLYKHNGYNECILIYNKNGWYCNLDESLGESISIVKTDDGLAWPVEHEDKVNTLLVPFLMLEFNDEM